MSFLAAARHFEFPRWWRIALVALGTLILCSCRAPLPRANLPQAGPPRPSEVRPASHHGAPPALPYPGHAADCETCPPMGLGHGPPAAAYGNGYPQLPPQAPLVSGLRPGDEYLCDGGDEHRPPLVGPDFRVYGMNVEDTAAHFDTLDGRRLVEPTNKVCIYAPRFAAVRQVSGMRQHEQHDLIGRVHTPLAAALHEKSLPPLDFHQPLQPVGQIGTKQASIFREQNRGVGLENVAGLLGTQAREALLAPVEAIETGMLEQAEKARLAAAIDAAITWSHDHGLQVMLGEQRLAVDTHDTRLGETFVAEYEGTPKLRIVKIASRKEAQPGDVVEFTLRFDNLGDELIGNVTIIDNLTTRLEYLPDSQSCTLEADFFVEPNEAESLALRWEIIAPMEPGEGGVIRFRCLVR